MQSKIYKLNTIINKPGYVENAQSSSILFAPVYIAKAKDPLYRKVEGEHCQAWYPVRCRDKLNDLPNILKLGIRIVDTNGFSFKYPEIFKDYGKNLMMSVTFEDFKDQEFFIKHFKLFTDFESKHKLKKSKIAKTTVDNTFLITSDIFWAQSPLHMSLYSFLLRSISYGDLTNYYSSRVLRKQLPDLNIIEDMLALIRDMHINPSTSIQGIDVVVCRLFLQLETSLNNFMSALPFITSEESITGYCDEKCIDVMENYDEWDTPKAQFSFTYESELFRPMDISTTFFRRTPHCYSGFYSLLSQIPYILKGIRVNQRLRYVPIWVLRYIEYLYNNGHQFSTEFSLNNFKQK